MTGCYSLPVSMRRAVIIAAALLVVWPATAQAFVVTAEYAGAKARVPNPHQFEAIIGYPGQCASGVPCWQYTKGTRSQVATYPESWYLHVAGRRVRDRIWHFYVMDPASAGWRQHVAAACAHLCFIDGMGSSSLARMVPRPAVSSTAWVASLALIVRAVRAAGKQAMPNSVGLDERALVAVAGQASSEGFTPGNAAAVLAMGHIWVTERGGCAAKYAAFKRYAGAGDHFGCFDPPARPWDLGWVR